MYAWDELPEGDRQSYRRVVEALYRRAIADAAEVARYYGDEGIKMAIRELGV